MNPWWWVPAGLAAWFLVAIAVALVLGPFLAGNCCEPAQDGSDGGQP